MKYPTGVVAFRTKDPDATIGITIDWSDFLIEGETISSSIWIMQSGLTLADETEDAETTTAYISGGENGSDYLATNRIVTSATRGDDRSVLIRVRER